MLMAKQYTENDLLRYLYHELNEQERLEIEAQLITDSDLQAAFLNLKAGKSLLAQLEAEPSATSIELIMEYSAKTAQSMVVQD